VSRPSRVLVVLIAGAAAGGLTGCAPDESPPVASDVMREGVDMVILGMETHLTRSGIRRARVRADTAEFVTENELHLRPVEVTFYDTDGREASVITATSGILFELTEDMEAHGSIVVLDRRDDQRLETERLRYLSDQDRLYGDVPFTMYTDGGATVVSGASFESDPGLDSLMVVDISGQSARPVAPPPAPPSGRVSGDTAPVAIDSGSVVPDTAAAVRDTAASRDTVRVGANRPGEIQRPPPVRRGPDGAPRGARRRPGDR